MFTLGIWFFILWMAFMVVCSGLFFWWGMITHQFEDIEEPKYRMLEDHEIEPWPKRTPKSAASKINSDSGRK